MAAIKLLLTIACLASNARSLPTNVNFNGINEFSLRLLDNIAADKEENFVVSAVSVWNIFTLLAEGAAGNTFQELMIQLNLPKDHQLTRMLYSSADKILSTNDSQVTLQRVASMFIDRDLSVHGSFCELAYNTYNTNVKLVDTKNATKLAQDINYFICVATNGRIKETVRSEALENLRLILVDAIYFKAQWTQAFDQKKTREEDFYDDRGRKLGKVNMMYQKGKNNVAYIEDISAQALELSYGPDRTFSMIILLPYEGTPLKRLIKNLSTYTIKDLNDNLRRDTDSPDVDCYVPRFKITSELDLIKPLRYMGLNDIFESDRATLPGVSDNPLYVSTVLQKAEIEVNEDGTVAAAATVVGVEDRILGPRVEVNKPFVYMITERESNLLLFSGVYNSPTLL